MKINKQANKLDISSAWSASWDEDTYTRKQEDWLATQVHLTHMITHSTNTDTWICSNLQKCTCGKHSDTFTCSLVHRYPNINTKWHLKPNVYILTEINTHLHTRPRPVPASLKELYISWLIHQNFWDPGPPRHKLAPSANQNSLPFS